MNKVPEKYKLTAVPVKSQFDQAIPNAYDMICRACKTWI